MADDTGPGLRDGFGRAVTYVRLSVTDRCDFRCVYCMPERMRFLPRAEVLSLEELARLGQAFVACGVRKLRLTGGEPLVRRDVMGLARALGGLIGQGLEELTLTTNGSQLGRYAAELYAAGVRRVNVSVDSLRPERFAAITRRGRLASVLEGIEAAAAAGLQVKLNTVALRGVNDDEFDDLLAWCGVRGFDLCLIETMPMGEVDEDRTDRYLPLDAVRADLARRWSLTPMGFRSGGPARYDFVGETGTRLGFITPMTHNFCESCNRVRVTCTGQLYLCLGQDDQVDLRGVLREGGDVVAAIRAAMARKPRGHDFVIGRDQKPAVARTMSLTGG